MFQPRSIHSSLSLRDKILSIDYILVISIFILGLVSILAMYSTDGGELKNHTEIEKRLIASDEASKILGFKWIERNNYPDNKMDTCSTLDIVKHIEKEAETIGTKDEEMAKSVNEYLNIDSSFFKVNTWFNI